jgi:hypothetical protein
MRKVFLRILVLCAIAPLTLPGAEKPKTNFVYPPMGLYKVGLLHRSPDVMSKGVSPDAKLLYSWKAKQAAATAGRK